MNRLSVKYTRLLNIPIQRLQVNFFIQKRFKSDYDFKPMSSKGSLFVHPANDPQFNDTEWQKKYFHRLDDPNFDYMEWLREGVMKFTNTYDISPESFQRFILKHRVLRIRTKQTIDPRAVDVLGEELAVAHMVLGLGGAVKLVGEDRWIIKVKGQQSRLPRTPVQHFHIEGIDLTGTHVMYEGLEYLVRLKDLRFLRLRRCPFVTDHCVSRLTQLSDSLQFLDLSNCLQLTSRAIATLWSMKNLRRLLLAGNPFMEDKELVCLMLEEKLPQLYVEGIDFLQPLSEEQLLAVKSAAVSTASVIDGVEDGEVEARTPKLPPGRAEASRDRKAGGLVN